MSIWRRLGWWGRVGVTVLVLAGGTVVLLLYGGCKRRTDVSDGSSHTGRGTSVLSREGASIVFIVVDALRPDVLGCYGGQANTPNIDALAGQGAVFERCFANAPWTAPSMASLLTSHHPSLCTEGEEFQFLAGRVPTLAEVLRGAGYRTGAVVSSPWLKKEFGFDRGFDDHRYVRGRGEEKAPGEEVTKAALDKLRAWRGERFFLLVHYIDLHMPYGAKDAGYKGLRERELRRVGSLDSMIDSSSLSQADREYVRGLYCSTVEAVDGEIGRLLRGIKEVGIKGGTAVVLTADHGEEFWEHGKVGHGDSYYDETLHVPLVVCFPGIEGGRRVRGQVQLLDLMPTLADLAGLSSPLEVEGTSLLPLVQGEQSEELPVYGEGSRGRGASRCVRSDGLKVIYNTTTGQAEIYDLVADPKEKQDVAASPPARAVRVLSELKAWARLMEAVRASRRLESERRRPLAATTIEELRSLGYVNPG